MSVIEEAFYNLVSQGATGRAINEMVESQLPGRTDGPADAYRHILLAAELTRRYGEDQAWILLNGHEFTGDLGDQNPDARVMDEHNNQLGIDLGNQLRQDPFITGWNDVVNGARSLIDPSNGNGDTARWLPESSWKVNPTDDTGARMANDDPRLKWPNPDWSEGPNPFNRHALFDDFFNATDAVREQFRDYLNGFVNDLLGAIGALGNGDEWGALIDDLVANFFTTSTQAIQPIRRDPLVIDLDNDGLETTGINPTNPIRFDHDADGIKTATGWVKSDDAFLVLDKNGNGLIDNGRELFGDATLKSNGQLAHDGFDALKDLDSNSDGKISSGDAKFASLRLWRDLNQDGVSQSNELFTLGSQNIAAINVASTEHSEILSNGNQIADLGSYVKTDGTVATIGEVTGNLGDINLAQDTFHSQFTDTLDTSTVANLPDMQACPERSRRGAGQNFQETANDHIFEIRRVA